jgi:hypothetical protein
MDPKRISPRDAREKVKSGDALFVCAYEDEAKCRSNNLEGSIPFGEFKRRLPTLSKEQSIVLY